MISGLLARLVGLKWLLLAVPLLAACGGGFAWGESHAMAIAAVSAAKDAEARVTAAHKADQVMLTDYLAKLSRQTARGDALSAQLAAEETKLAAGAKAARERLSYVMPENSACDLSADAVALLRAQPAHR